MYASSLRKRPQGAFVIASGVACYAWQATAGHGDNGKHEVRQDGSHRFLGTNPATLPTFASVTHCEKTNVPLQPGITTVPLSPPHNGASWIRRNLLAPIGIPLPKPRLLTSKDQALKLSAKYVRRRQRDEVKMRQLLEKAPSLGQDPEKIKALSEELFEVTYGKGITAQEREDFLVRYGCTGWNEAIIQKLLEVAGSRGIVEMGAGHGQWARALTEAHAATVEVPPGSKQTKRFDFVLAYDDNSNLPLNTHIYNAYTQPHHDYFGRVYKLESKNQMLKVLRSFSCRGRVLLLVYPPPGNMATQVVINYVNAAPEDNDTVIYVGEGRGGANGDDSLFDYFERGDWELIEEMDVQRPPGDKGYEKLFILRRLPQFHLRV